MAKTTTRTKSAKAPWGMAVRGRDAEFPSAPIRVSEDAQAKNVDINTARKFDFGRQPRDRLPDRPSTSGGLATRFAMRRNAEKRETHDDLHLNPLAVHGKVTTFYNFPLPGMLPTPTDTPTSSPPLPQHSSLKRSDTPESMDGGPGVMNLGQAEIGMALGSPTQQPTAWHQDIPFEPSDRTDSPDDQDNWANPPVPYKPKTSKWKILGGFFGGGKKQNAALAQPFYQLQPEVSHQTAAGDDFIHFDGPATSSEKKPAKSRGRGRTNSERKGEKNKPEMKRAKTAPLNFNFQDSETGQMETPEITLDGGPMIDDGVQSHQKASHHVGLMLDVDIPSTQMERYSIMFGSVLQKPTNTSSSLLTRRQATLDKLKTVNEALASKEQEIEEKTRQMRPRRATSPQPTKSPAFSLFPNTPSRLQLRDVTPSPSTHPSLHRSNTSPAALSPSRPSFAPGPDNEMHATLLAPAPHVPQDKRGQFSRIRTESKDSKKNTNESPELQQVESQWSPEQSHLALESPDNGECETEDTYVSTLFPMKPKLEEPSWHMITAPGSISGSSSSRSHGHSVSTSASSTSTTSTPHSASSSYKQVKMQAPPPTTRSRSATTSAVRLRPSEVSNADFSSPSRPRTSKSDHHTDDDDERQEHLKTAADISIARQISVSRQQRQLIIPIKGSGSKRINPNSPSPLNIGRVASPLGVVAAGIESPITGRAGNPLVAQKEIKKTPTERLVAAAAKPSTPTLVVVGDAAERAWGGATTANNHAFAGTDSGEIKVGLAIGSPSMAEHQHRKSERVVVERVSVASS